MRDFTRDLLLSVAIIWAAFAVCLFLKDHPLLDGFQLEASVLGSTLLLVAVAISAIIVRSVESELYEPLACRVSVRHITWCTRHIDLTPDDATYAPVFGTASLGEVYLMEPDGKRWAPTSNDVIENAHALCVMAYDRPLHVRAMDVTPYLAHPAVQEVASC